MEQKNIPEIKKGGTALFLNNNQYDGKSYYDNIHTNADGTKSTYGLQQFINTLTLSNNVLIRNEFSKGTLSFAEQLKQYTEIVKLFGNFEADVTFIGHSMGGLSSINYAVDYHFETGKDIDVITISTPYDDNIYASVPSNIEKNFIPAIEKYISPQVIEKSKETIKRMNTPAHKELAGIDETNEKKRYARDKLEEKWNNYEGNIDLISIGVDCIKYLGDGDMVVSLESQLNLKDGKEIYKNSTKILIETFDKQTIYELKEDEKTKKLELLEGSTKSEWHSTTPDLKDVIETTNELIMK